MSALSDVENLRLHDIADGDVRDDPRWLALMGEGAMKAFLQEMARKHLPGQHNQDSHGNDHGGIDVPNPLDKLKLGKRAPAGFRVRSSKKIKTDYADVGIAEVDGPDGPQVRVGVIGNESGKWDAGFTGESRKAELRQEIARKQALMDSDSDDVDDDIEDQISELRSELEDLEGERTAIVSPEAMADFRRQLGEGLEVAKANKAKVDADAKAQDAIDEKRAAIIAEFSDAEMERGIHELSWRLRQAQGIVRDLENDLASGRSRHGWDPEFTAERLASWKEKVAKYEAELAPLLARRAELMPPDARARLEDLDRQFNALNDVAIDDMLTAAEVSAPSGTRIRAEIWGSDDEDEQWVSTRLYVLAPGETSDDIDDDYGSFRGLKGLNKLIAGLESSGDLPKSSRRDTQGKHLPRQVRRGGRMRRKHLPGEHDQGAHGHRGVGDIAEAALDGITIYSPEKIKEIYGDEWDGAGVRLGDDGVHLMARYFENGDMHVSWDLPDGSSQVLEEMNVESMRQFADDIERVLDDFDDAEFDRDGLSPTDVVADADSEKHGFYIYADRDGDIRIDPEGSGTSPSAFDISAAHAREFVAVLNSMADGYEDHFDYGDPDEKSAGKSASKGASMATKSFNPTIKAVGEGTATLKIASFGEVDKDGDVTEPGYFGVQHVQMVPTHDWNHVWIGKGRIYEKADGAYCDVKFNLKIQAAKDWYEAIKFDFENPPSLAEYSYGFEVLPGGSKAGQHQGRQVRYLTPRDDGTPGAKVFEVSPVLQGAGTGTRTAGVKAADRRRGAVATSPSRAVKGAIPSHETKTVSRAWDRVRTEAALPDDARPSDFRSVYAYVDPDGDPELKASYSFPHHHGIGGPANLRACLMGIAQLNGPAGADMGDAERKGIYDHLAAHLKDADRDIPDLRTGPGDNSKSRFSDEAATVLASVSGLIDRASEVMALRQRKGKGMAGSTADLLGWVSDEMVRLKHLLANPVEPEAPQPSEEEIHSLMVASMARIRGIAPGA